jgi:hypothetical protein
MAEATPKYKPRKPRGRVLTVQPGEVQMHAKTDMQLKSRAQITLGYDPPLKQKKKSGRSVGKPQLLPPDVIKAAQDNLIRELPHHPRWRHQAAFAVKHVIKFLKDNMIEVNDRQTRTIRRHIVDPVLKS